MISFIHAVITTILVITIPRLSFSTKIETQLPYDPHRYSLPAGVHHFLPNLRKTFSCEGRPYGYYADPDNDCKIYHICVPVKDSEENLIYTQHFTQFCNHPTVFNQLTLTCTYPETAPPCAQVINYYGINSQFGNEDTSFERYSELSKKKQVSRAGEHPGERTSRRYVGASTNGNDPKARSLELGDYDRKSENSWVQNFRKEVQTDEKYSDLSKIVQPKFVQRTFGDNGDNGRSKIIESEFDNRVGNVGQVTVGTDDEYNRENNNQQPESSAKSRESSRMKNIRDAHHSRKDNHGSYVNYGSDYLHTKVDQERFFDKEISNNQNKDNSNSRKSRIQAQMVNNHRKQLNYANHWVNFEDRRREEDPELLKETSYTTSKNEDLENFSKTEDINSDKKDKEAVYLHRSWHSNDSDFSENAAKDISNPEDNQDLNKSFETDEGNFQEDQYQSPPSIKDRFIQESEINKELDDKNSRRVGEYDIVEGKDGQLYAIRVEDSGESADGTPNKRYRKIGSILDIIRISNGHTNGPRWEPQHGREHEYDKTQEVDQSLDLRNTDDVNDENDIRAYGQINLGLDLNEPNLETSRWASLDESTTRSTDRNTNPHQSDRSSDEEGSENREHKDANVNRMLAIEEERVNHKIADGDFDHLIFEDLNAFTEVKDRNDLSDTKTEAISIGGSQIEDDDNVDEDTFKERRFQKNLRSHGHSEISLKDHNKPNIEGLKNSEIFQNIDKTENTQESDGRSRKSKKIAQNNSDDFSKHRQRVQVEEDERHLLDEAWFWTPNKIQDVEFDGQDGKISVEENEKLEQDRHIAGEELYKVNLPKHVTIVSEIDEYGTFEEVIPMDVIQEDHQLERSKERVDARVNEPDTENILGDESESENEARYERKIHEDGDFGQKILKVSKFSSKETGLIDESIEEEIYPISDSQIADSFGSGEEDGMDHRRGELEDSNILNAQHQDIKEETKRERIIGDSPIDLSWYRLPSSSPIIIPDIRQKFNCYGKPFGYYADMDNECKIYHVCVPELDASTNFLKAVHHFSFMCEEKTVFDQIKLTCTRPQNAQKCS